MDNDAKPYAMWGSLGVLMRRDKRFILAVYVTLGSILLFTFLLLNTGLDIFRWLAYLSLAVVIALGIGGEVVNNKSRDVKGKDQRFTLAADLIFGSVLLFAFLYFFLRLDIFRWLLYLSLAVMLVLGIGGKMGNIRGRF